MKRNNLLDLYRSILVIFVLLYHLGICEAGFLAVCGFFTLSGYLLACSINSSDFNLKDFYKKRIKSLYIPLIVVVFTTVFVFRYVVDISWVSIKQETLSVLFSYNNIFQIQANSDYFLRSDASPFTHMWYISILIQVEFVIPFVASILKKYNHQCNKKLLFLITLLSMLCFTLVDNKLGRSISYYSTFSRLFSLLIGYCAYYINKSVNDNKITFATLVLIVISFFSNDLSQKYYVLLMISVSLLSACFIVFSKDIDFKEIRIVKLICKNSYFVYLIQYPIIYIINTGLRCVNTLKIIISLSLIILSSIIYALGFSNGRNRTNIIIKVLIILMTISGIYGYITCPDYYKQMDELKAQLEVNQEILETKQAEYLNKIQEKQQDIINNVTQIDEALNNLDEATKNANLLLIGDSIMLGGSFNLDEYFDNYYCDAKGSRNGFLGHETLSELLDKGIDPDYIVIHLGTNSGLELEEVESISSLIDRRKVFWLTVTNGWKTSENPMLKEYCETHDNNYLIDWESYSFGHKEYFVEDGLHLSKDGRHIYDQLIFDNLKEVVKQDLLSKKQEIIDNYNSENNNSISFYGNDILINLYDYIDSNSYLCYSDSDYSFDSLYRKLSDNKNNLLLSKTVFILLDKNIVLNDGEIDKINELLKDNTVYIFAYNKNVNNLETILSYDCYLQEGIHLNEKGKKILLNEITKKMQ